jgi:hypothetical protein
MKAIIAERLGGLYRLFGNLAMIGGWRTFKCRSCYAAVEDESGYFADLSL